MVVLLVTGLVPPAVAGLLAAGALVVLRVVSMERAYRSITWTTVVLVAAMLPLSTAMFETGAADLVAEVLDRRRRRPRPVRAARRAVRRDRDLRPADQQHRDGADHDPDRRVAASELGVDVRPVLMSICVAAAAALLTPVATPVNLIAMGAAGYRFGDYWKLGSVVMAVFFVVGVFLVPVFWPF